MRFPRTVTTAASLIASLACTGGPDREIVVTADNQAKVWIDEALRGEVLDWRQPLRIELAADEMPKVVAVEAHNIDSAAGLIGAMLYVKKDPAVEQPANWLCSREPANGWQRASSVWWRIRSGAKRWRRRRAASVGRTPRSGSPTNVSAGC